MSAFFQVYVENWGEWWPQILEAARVTLGLWLGAFLLALVLGLLLAMAKLSRRPWLRALASGYIEFARGIPALAILFLVYFGLVPLGIVLDAFWAGIVGLGLSAAAYMAETFRAGIAAVHRGQREAALAVGMTPLQSFRWIILPQALQMVLPPILNLAIALLKDTSLCSLITAPELMLRGKDLAMMYFQPMQIFLLAGAIYFVLAWPLSLAARRLEQRLRRGRRAA